jgi:hypothetical protein
VEDLPGREMDSRTFFLFYISFHHLHVLHFWFAAVGLVKSPSSSEMDYIPDMTHVPVKILIKSQFM